MPAQRVHALRRQQLAQRSDALQWHLQILRGNLADLIQLLTRALDRHRLRDNLPLRIVVRRHIVQDADKDPLLALDGLPKGQQRRKHAAILAPRRHLAALAEDLAFAGVEVVLKITVVRCAVRFGHQYPHVAAEQFTRRVTEQPCHRIVDMQHRPFLVDGHHAIDHRLQNRALPADARLQAAHEQRTVALFGTTYHKQQCSTDQQQRQHQCRHVEVDGVHRCRQRRHIRQHQQLPMRTGQFCHEVPRHQGIRRETKMLLEHIPSASGSHLDQSGVVAVDQQDTHTRNFLGSRNQLGNTARRHTDEEQPCLTAGKRPAGNEIEVIGAGYRVDRRCFIPGPAKIDRLREGGHSRPAHRPHEAVEILEHRLAVGIGHRESEGPPEQALHAGLQGVDGRPVFGRTDDPADLGVFFLHKRAQALVLSIDEPGDLVSRRQPAGTGIGCGRLLQRLCDLMAVIHDGDAGGSDQQQWYPEIRTQQRAAFFLQSPIGRTHRPAPPECSPRAPPPCAALRRSPDRCVLPKPIDITAKKAPPDPSSHGARRASPEPRCHEPWLRRFLAPRLGPLLAANPENLKDRGNLPSLWRWLLSLYAPVLHAPSGEFTEVPDV